MLLSNSTSPYFGTAQQNTRVQNVRYDRFVKQRSGGSCGRCLLIQVWLLSSCLQFQLMKRKRTWRNKEKTPWGNEVDGLAQVFTMLSKRSVDSKQKNRRCSAKESTILFKRSDDAKRKQSIYSQISLNCYASGGSKTGPKHRKIIDFPLGFREAFSLFPSCLWIIQ